MSVNDSQPERVGIIPAAGKASRISPIPCSKELMPIGFGELGAEQPRPKVASHYLLDKYRVAGVSKVYVILRKGKWDIPAYYGDGSMLDMHFAYLLMHLPYGVPYTLDGAYPFVRNAKVMMGFPDMLFGPDNAFALADATLAKKDADMVIGLYPPRDERQISKCDMVQWDDESGRIERIVIKPQSSDLDLIWVFGIWTSVFTEFMHDFLVVELEKRKRTNSVHEIHLGQAVQAAVDAGLRVYGHAFPNHRFIDIGTADELAEAYHWYRDSFKGMPI